MARDPVCGMTVDEKTPVVTVVYKDKEYYFCSNQCAQKFKEAPEKYAKTEEKDS